MKEKIILQLKAYLKTLGVKNLSNERMNAIADRLTAKFPDLAEDDIDSKLSDFNDLQPFEEIAKNDDRVRSLEAKQPKEKAPEEKSSEKKKEGEKEPAQQESATEKMLRELTEKFTLLEKEKAIEKAQLSFQKKMQDKKIPPVFYKGRALPETEDEIEALATEIENDYTTFKQEEKNEELGGVTRPVGSTGPTKVANDKELDTILEKI